MNDIPKLSSISIDDYKNIEHLFHLLGNGAISIPKSYLHWSRLNEETPPQYLLPREWWLALKIQRLHGRQEIGLNDQEGNPFTLGSIEFFAEAAYQLDRPRLSRTSENKTYSRGLLDQLSVRAMREEAIASVQLDGMELEYEVAQELLRTGRRSENAVEQAALNIHRVLERIREIRAQPLTLATLADLHQRITNGTVTKTGLAGRLRQTTSPTQPAAEELPARLIAMLTFANGRTPEHFIHPLLRAAALHFWVLHDQPFTEGNGRMARALYYWSMLHAGYPVFERLSLSRVYRDAPTAYQSAFAEVAQDENDLLHFVAHVFEAIAKAQRHGDDDAYRLETEVRVAKTLAGAAFALNSRQSLLIARALNEPGFRRTLQEHARDHNLVRQTARNDFAPLVKLGWFEEAKVGRALTFFPMPDLATKLGQIKVD